MTILQENSFQDYLENIEEVDEKVGKFLVEIVKAADTFDRDPTDANKAAMGVTLDALTDYCGLDRMPFKEEKTYTFRIKGVGMFETNSLFDVMEYVLRDVRRKKLGRRKTKFTDGSYIDVMASARERRKYEFVYAWCASKSLDTWWFNGNQVGSVLQRDIYADPRGKHSRKRAKAGALVNKPPGACTLVAIKRRVKY